MPRVVTSPRVSSWYSIGNQEVEVLRVQRVSPQDAYAVNFGQTETTDSDKCHVLCSSWMWYLSRSSLGAISSAVRTWWLSNPKTLASCVEPLYKVQGVVWYRLPAEPYRLFPSVNTASILKPRLLFSCKSSVVVLSTCGRRRNAKCLSGIFSLRI